MSVTFVRLVVGAAAVALIASCGSGSDSKSSQQTGDLRTDIVRTLSADEAANLAVALAQLPATAQVSHIVPDGPIVALHYVNAGTSGSVAVADFIEFDTAHAITARDTLESPLRVESNLIGASVTIPEAANNEAEAANKRAVIAFITTLNASPDQAMTSLSEDFVDHAFGDNRGGWLTRMNGMHFTFGIKSIAAWDDIVGVAITVAVTRGGTQTFLPGYDFFRLRDGKIVERWNLNY